MESENNDSLAFLDVLVTRQHTSFVTTIYRKPTFSGLYLNWFSFAPLGRKINLIRTLVHRALKICSPALLSKELDTIFNVLIENGYPRQIVSNTITKKIDNFSLPKKFGPLKCPVYIKLPWTGQIGQNFAHQVLSVVEKCFYSVNTRVIFKTRSAFPSFVKDPLPIFMPSNVIYLFKCRCDADYIGRTSQNLEARIKQHVSSNLRRNIENRTTQTTQMIVDSSIGQHLLDNVDCAQNYNDSTFSIIHHASSSYQLKILEAIAISIRKPSLCSQRDFNYTLELIRDPH